MIVGIKAYISLSLRCVQEYLVIFASARDTRHGFSQRNPLDCVCLSHRSLIEFESYAATRAQTSRYHFLCIDQPLGLSVAVCRGFQPSLFHANALPAYGYGVEFDYCGVGKCGRIS